MAKILDQEQQKKALDNINESIRSMKKINSFLTASNPDGEYSFSFKDEEGKKQNAVFNLTDKSDLVNFFKNFKKSEKDRIVVLAEANRIELDPEDYEVMDYQVDQT